MISSVEYLCLQYDQNGRSCPSLHYHFIDEHVADIFIANIQRAEFHRIYFHVSDDYKYLILCDTQVVSIANIETISEAIKFKPIFKLSQDVFYVSENC